MGALGVGGPSGTVGSAAIFRTVVDTAIQVAAGGTVADAAKTAGAGLVKGAIAGAIGAGIAAYYTLFLLKLQHHLRLR